MFLISHILGPLLLPVFMLMILAGMAGAKPESVLKPILDIAFLLLKTFIELLGMTIRAICEILIYAITASKLDARFKNAVARQFGKPRKIKVTVVDDEEGR